MFRVDLLRDQLQDSPLESITAALLDSTSAVMKQRRHGDTDRWLDIIDALPEACPSVVALNQPIVTLGQEGDMNAVARTRLRQLLLELHPWRKGPFDLFGILIDSEWRSSLKWSRLENAIRPLKDRLVLDIGCGNGYYILRMLGAGARYVLGIDPTQLFVAQFNALKTYHPGACGTILPLRCEELPLGQMEDQGTEFDVVFSMGILYHRKNPKDHIVELYRCLRTGGELVMETLILNDGGKEILVPQSTYAKMRNVWCIPTEGKLKEMLQEAGFKEIATIDVSTTTVVEQRQTQWMHFESLSAFLDADDKSKTIEGYAAPTRIIVTCVK